MPMIFLKPKTYNLKPISGFTIVEILVVLAITALLSSFIITYTGTGRAQVALYVEEAKLSQTILRAKSLAISTYNTPTVPCGYGLHVDYLARTYAIFSYKPTLSSCAAITEIDPNDIDAYQQIGDAFPLAPELNFVSDPGTRYLDTVFFTPPNPRTYLWVEGSADADMSDSGKIYVATKNNSLKSTIEVTSSGQVNTSH